MRTVSSNNTTVLPLGKQGENLAEKIIFTDPISWLKGYGPGTVQLLNQRPGEDTPYPVVISEESDGSYSWAVTAADTALAGQGKCELRYLSGDTVVKSHTWRTVINDALGEPSDTPPESQKGWVDQVLAAGTSAQEAAKRAEDAAVRQPYPNEETGTWWVWDAVAESYQDTGISYGGSGGGTTDHTKLTGRNEADQHPMSAITGLEKALDGKQPKGNYLTDKDIDATLKEARKAADAKAVGDAISSLSEEIVTTSESKVSAHNTGADTHSDIRLLIQGLTDRLNALADSDDTALDQLSEVVAYIKSNRSLIEAITTSKVSVADIVDNLTTNAANKPLSAAQGVAIKALIDGIVIPDKLPNPNALTFTGAVTGSYDGSAPVSVEIPSGGGSGGGSSGGSGKAKSQILIDQEITELTASLSVTLEHDFHNLTAIISCGSAGDALTAGSDGTAVASKIGLLIDTTSFSYNSRKVAYIDTSTTTWITRMFGAEWSDDLSVFKRGFAVEIATSKYQQYSFPFGGTTAMYGTLGTEDNVPRTGKTANVVVNGAYLNVGTRVVLWGEYYE